MADSIGVGKTYTTITAWEADLGGAASNDGEVYDEVYDEAFTLNAGTPNLYPASGEGHDGSEGSGARVAWSTQRYSIQLSQGSAKITQMEFDGNSNHLQSGGINYAWVWLSSSAGFNQRLLRCILHDFVEDSEANNFNVALAYRSNQGFANCVVYSCEKNVADRLIHGLQINGTNTSFITNCTIHDISNAHSSASADARGLKASNNANHDVKNNIVTDTTVTHGSATASDFYGLGSSTDAATNASSDSTAEDPISGEPVVSSTEYTSTGSPPDLSLASGAKCADLTTNPGTDLGSDADLATDILGRNRDSEGDTWSLGAFQYVAAAGAPLAMMLHNHGG